LETVVAVTFNKIYFSNLWIQGRKEQLEGCLAGVWHKEMLSDINSFCLCDKESCIRPGFFDVSVCRNKYPLVGIEKSIKMEYCGSVTKFNLVNLQDCCIPCFENRSFHNFWSLLRTGDNKRNE